MSDLEEITTAAALADLARAEILRDEDPVGFVHPLVRDAVYRACRAAERALAHERAARLLRRRGGSAEQVGAHLLLAPSRGDAGGVDVLSAAARTAAARGASESAVTYLRRALAEPAEGPVRLDVLRALGLLETLVDGPAGLEHLGAAYELATEPAARAELAVAIAWTHVFTSSPGVAAAFAQEAAAALPGDLVDARQGLVALQRISGFMHGLDPARWQAGSRAGRAGRRRLRPDAGRDAGLGGRLRRHRPGPGRGAGPVRLAGRPAVRGGQRAVLGGRRERADDRRRRSRATSGSGPGPRRTPAARCSPRCR